MKCIIIVFNLNISIVWKWFKIDNFIYKLFNKSIYLISKVSRGDKGLYNCMVRNFVGIFIVVILYLDV